MLVFAFTKTKSEAILRLLALPELEKVFLSGQKSIDILEEIVLATQPKYILGIGEYSGRDKEAIRIETICSNKFRNTLSGSKLEYKEINPFVVAGNEMKTSKGMGNSWCNLVSYRLMSLPDMRGGYTFLHIPKSFDIKRAATLIGTQIAQIE